MIKEVKKKRNVIMVNKHHERGYDNEKGVMIIEEENGTKHIKFKILVPLFILIWIYIILNRAF